MSKTEVNRLTDWLLLIPAVVIGCLAAVGFGAAFMIRWALQMTTED